MVKDSTYHISFYVLPASGYGQAIDSYGVHFLGRKQFLGKLPKQMTKKFKKAWIIGGFNFNDYPLSMKNELKELKAWLINHSEEIDTNFSTGRA